MLERVELQLVGGFFDQGCTRAMIWKLLRLRRYLTVDSAKRTWHTSVMYGPHKASCGRQLVHGTRYSPM
jgi:hypothetical protein